jgi:peptide/nickel transport system ATP-binding protein
MSLLSLKNLSIDYQVRGRLLHVVENVNLSFASGSFTAIIGESGCGKTTLMSAVLGTLANNSRVSPQAEVIFKGQQVLALSKEAQRLYRWKAVSMVFQAAQNALSPTLTIGEQLCDSLFDHRSISKTGALEIAAERLREVRLTPERIFPAYPHQLSGGMRQRVMIAMAMILQPDLMLLDEPTTALDVITQRYIFDILKDLHHQGQTMILITHDLASAQELADTVVVMYGGQIMEQAPAEGFFSGPRHPYSEGLLNALPRVQDAPREHTAIPGHPPDLAHKPGGCIFHPRCALAEARCRTESPALKGTSWRVACHVREGI